MLKRGFLPRVAPSCCSKKYVPRISTFSGNKKEGGREGGRGGGREGKGEKGGGRKEGTGRERALSRMCSKNSNLPKKSICLGILLEPVAVGGFLGNGIDNVFCCCYPGAPQKGARQQPRQGPSIGVLFEFHDFCESRTPEG